MQLLRPDNSFLGSLSVITGEANKAWEANTTTLTFGNSPATSYAVQSRVRINGVTVNIGGGGIVADIVAIRADRLATVGPTATIVARLPFDSTRK